MSSLPTLLVGPCTRDAPWSWRGCFLHSPTKHDGHVLPEVAISLQPASGLMLVSVFEEEALKKLAKSRLPIGNFR